eukprot:SAG31_NODE_4415_length_3229_cov_11.320330_2_plen_80_part_00
MKDTQQRHARKLECPCDDYCPNLINGRCILRTQLSHTAVVPARMAGCLFIIQHILLRNQRFYYFVVLYYEMVNKNGVKH